MTALLDTADTAELIISNARITTMDKDRRRATAVAIAGGKVLAVGCGADIARYAGEGTRRIDARSRTMVPGHGVPSLADASPAESSSALESPHVG